MAKSGSEPNGVGRSGCPVLPPVPNPVPRHLLTRGRPPRKCHDPDLGHFDGRDAEGAKHADLRMFESLSTAESSLQVDCYRLSMPGNEGSLQHLIAWPLCSARDPHASQPRGESRISLAAEGIVYITYASTTYIHMLAFREQSIAHAIDCLATQ